MEKYIRSLNDYQQHLEDKYGLMLEKFQQVILEQEQHAYHINSKDTEIKHLKQDIAKKSA